MPRRELITARQHGGLAPAAKPIRALCLSPITVSATAQNVYEGHSEKLATLHL
jgi:hypothetical protein